jgi:hypothetical protein
MRHAAVLSEQYPLSASGLEAKCGELDGSSTSRARQKFDFGKSLSQVIQRAELRVGCDYGVEMRCIALSA